LKQRTNVCGSPEPNSRVNAPSVNDLRAQNALAVQRLETRWLYGKSNFSMQW